MNDSVTREAINRDEQRKFLDFVKQDRHFSKYYDGIFILFNTGLRISEFVGLTIKDVDLKGKKLTVDHQLQRTSNMEYIIEKPKTEAGNRVIPISDEVCAAFRRIIDNRPRQKVEPMIGGGSRFSVYRQEWKTDGGLALGKVFSAYPREVQFHLQGANAKGNAPCVPPYLLQQYGPLRDESQNTAVSDGTFGYKRNS